MEDDQIKKVGLDIYTRPFQVRYSETGGDGLVKPVKIFDYCQDAAMEHADLLGVSGEHLRVRHLAWFVVRYRVQFYDLPRWNQSLVLKTWRYPERNLYEIRCYEMWDAKDHLMMQGQSALVIIDTLRKHPVRLKNALPPECLAVGTAQTERFADIPAITQPEFEQPFAIRKQDLDFNGHVNNAVFIGWGLENVPEDGGRRFMPSAIEVNYLSDIRFGQTVKAQVQRLTTEACPAFLYRIVDGQDDHETTRMRIIWKPC